MTTPGIRIEKGETTDEELAALTVLLLTRSTPTTSTDPDPDSPHSSPWRPDPFHAPHSWQTS
ncbi:acyl-CoA carboxylase epsilon subunit [Streptomyces sp. NPDC058470]|uniref:acyl-CoA carboxylase epsilon subunit n=1 Tax=Streptomyces sp. NPDC058470 TaxID=3346515 RepID=UPI0036650C4D